MNPLDLLEGVYFTQFLIFDLTTNSNNDLVFRTYSVRERGSTCVCYVRIQVIVLQIIYMCDIVLTCVVINYIIEPTKCTF
jgi:hypothetical protein